MIRHFMAIATLSLGLLGAGGVLAQVQDPQEPAATYVDDLIVDGRNISQAARAFVEVVAEPPPGTRAARWNRSLCISVTGMRRDFAQYLIDRMSVVALDAGAEVDGPGCQPNVIIQATGDGRALAAELVEGAGLAFQPSINGTNLGRDALNDFLTSDRAVRWWHVSFPVEPDSGQIAIALKGQAPPTVTVRDASRLRSNIRYDLGYVVIVLDMSRTEGVPFGALADYVAMTALTQVDPMGDFRGEDTILNLFQPGIEVGALTQWDLDYLAALYTAPTNRASAAQQARDIAQRLAGLRRDGLVDAEP